MIAAFWRRVSADPTGADPIRASGVSVFMIYPIADTCWRRLTGKR
jgi:hypothetical protein